MQRNNFDSNDGCGIRIIVGVVTENKATNNTLDGINCSNRGTIARILHVLIECSQSVRSLLVTSEGRMQNGEGIKKTVMAVHVIMLVPASLFPGSGTVAF